MKEAPVRAVGGGPAGVVEGLFAALRREAGVDGGVEESGTRYIAAGSG